MFETRSDVTCCSADAEAERLGMEAQRPAPKRPALSRVTERIKRRQFDKAPRVRTVSRVRPVRDRTRTAPAARCKRGHRCQAGSISMVPRRRRRRPLSLLVDGLRRSCQRRIQRGLDVDALSRSGRDCGSAAVGVVGVCAVRTDASTNAGSRRKGIPGRSKMRRELMSEPEESRGDEQSMQKQRVVRIVRRHHMNLDR